MHSSLVTDLLLDRRVALKAALGLGAGLVSAGSPNLLAAPQPGGLDYSDPADNLYAFGKLWAGYDKPVIGGFHGLMYLRIPGKRMVPVFGYTGTGALLARIDETRTSG